MGVEEEEKVLEDSRVAPERSDSVEPGEIRPTIPFHGEEAPINEAEHKSRVCEDMDVVSSS